MLTNATATTSQPKLIKVVNNGASADVKKELIQKVMANNKLKEQLQQQKLTTDEQVPDISDNEEDELIKKENDSFVVTPDYIQQSNFLDLEIFFFLYLNIFFFSN